MTIKWNLEKIRERLSEISPNIEILSEEYVSTRAKLRCRCLIDGHEWEATWANLLKGTGCWTCYIESQRLTLDKIKSFIEKESGSGCKLLSEEYKRNTGDLKFKCRCGMDFSTTWTQFKSHDKRQCNACGVKKMIDKKKLGMAEVTRRLLDLDINIKILGKEYINSRTPMRCKCLLDNYEWEITWANLSVGKGCPKCTGVAKPTIKEIRDRLTEDKPHIELLSTEYINNRSKLSFKCLLDEYEWETTWNSLVQGANCPRCVGQERLNLDTVKNRLGKINPNIEILSREFDVSNAYLECKCLIDNHTWRATWGNLSQGKGCPKCGGKLIPTIESVKAMMLDINPNIAILSDSYINAKTKLSCECLIDGYEWETTWNKLQQGAGCPRCGKVERLTLDVVKERLYAINPYIEILSETFETTHTHLKCRCLIDEHEWHVTWGNLSFGTGCPKCNNSSNGEIIISDVLKRYSIKNEEEVRIKECRDRYPLPFDFAILDNTQQILALLEYDGKQHFEPVDFAGRGEDWAKEQYKGVVNRDSIKTRYCKDNNIPLLRIPYWEFENIESILYVWLVKHGLMKDV